MITPPPILKGDEANQIKQLRSYLYQMSEDLSTTLAQVENGNITVQPGSELAKNSNAKEIDDAAANLKSMIIKNANIVKSEMDKLELALASTYLAKSDFGTFAENINASIEATAESITGLYDYNASISADLDTVATAFENYVVQTNGFIKAGIVDYDGAVPILGIAIGQNIQTSGTDTIDGTTYDVIEKNNMTIWTTEKLGFWINGAEVAYLSNDTLYITSAKILNVIDFGDEWEISFSNGFCINWVGDDNV